VPPPYDFTARSGQRDVRCLTFPIGSRTARSRGFWFWRFSSRNEFFLFPFPDMSFSLFFPDCLVFVDPPGQCANFMPLSGNTIHSCPTRCPWRLSTWPGPKGVNDSLNIFSTFSSGLVSKLVWHCSCPLLFVIDGFPEVPLFSFLRGPPWEVYLRFSGFFGFLGFLLFFASSQNSLLNRTLSWALWFGSYVCKTRPT